MKQAKPFLKWVGGKGQLLNKFSSFYPNELKEEEIKTYIEPFIGGGAVLFNLLQNYKIENAIIVDVNKELINCYKCLQKNVESLILKLKEIDFEYKKLNEEDRKNYYLKTRKEFNNSQILNEELNLINAAQLIFLNKTCFNGLYRVNKKNEFNVPFGRYENPLICDEENLKLVSNLLQSVIILHGDFTEIEKYINNKTFIYLDPPYVPLSKTSNFTSYSKNNFNNNEQIRLLNFIKECDNLGAKIMMSNSSSLNLENNLKNFNIAGIKAKRTINSDASKRGEVNEVVIRNYKNDTTTEKKVIKLKINKANILNSQLTYL